MKSEESPRRVAITTLGCKINQFESAAMTDALAKEGFFMVPFDGLADIYVINTCTVTAKTDAESRRLIRRAVRLNPAARIVVTGCYAQIAHEELRDMAGVNLVLGNTEKKGIAGLLKELGDEKRVLVSDISLEKGGGGTALDSFAEHTRAFLQVQNGCDAFCSYCIVPHARGRSRSVPLDEALEGIRAFAAKGYREVVLTGIHLGAYGLDMEPKRDLLDILVKVEEEQLLARLRIGSLEPLEVSDRLIDFLSNSGIVCPHLHIPLQGGDDSLLARMNRRYTTAYYGELLEKLTAVIPGICIGTDVIAGFPGESEQEFENACRFIESLPLAYMHVFPFSPREGTPAASMGGRLDPSVIKERAKVLRRISDEKKRAYCRGFIGEELLVLVQEGGSEGAVKGLSRNYLTVSFPGEGALINSEQRVRITELERDALRGELVIHPGR